MVSIARLDETLSNSTLSKIEVGSWACCKLGGVGSNGTGYPHGEIMAALSGSPKGMYRTFGIGSM